MMEGSETSNNGEKFLRVANLYSNYLALKCSRFRYLHTDILKSTGDLSCQITISLALYNPWDLLRRPIIPCPVLNEAAWQTCRDCRFR